MLALSMCILITSGVAPAAADESRQGPALVGSREIVVTYFVNDEVAEIELWVSRDGRITWMRETFESAGPDKLLYRADRDGEHHIFLRTRKATDASAPAPTRGTRAHASILVDTLAPVVQIHDASVEANLDHERTLVLTVSLIEEHLHENAVRLFFRGCGEMRWRDGGPVRRTPGHVAWKIPVECTERLDVRLTVTDAAGNEAGDEKLAIALDVANAISTPVDQEFVHHGDAGPTLTSAADAEEPAPPPDAPQHHGATSLPKEVAQLQALALRHLAERRPQLAVARLNEALASAPQHEGLLVNLGEALYGTGDLDGAAARFQQVLRTDARNREALAGLASIAAGKHRYSDSKSYLTALLELKDAAPDHWLALGDVEHRLGNRAEALRAWRRALEQPGAPSTTRERAARRIRLFGAP